MKTILTPLVLITCAALLSLAGCEQPASMFTDLTDDVELYAKPGSSNGAVTLPITIRMSTEWNVPGATIEDCPDLIDPGTNELFTAVGTGTGQGNHLGRFQFSGQHPTINVCPPNLDVERQGQFELAAADGSTLAGSYHFLLLPPGFGGFMTMFVEEGTGRFDGASGELELDWARSAQQPDCPDMVCLNNVTFAPVVFEGSLILPRPRP